MGKKENIETIMLSRGRWQAGEMPIEDANALMAEAARAKKLGRNFVVQDGDGEIIQDISVPLVSDFKKRGKEKLN